ncbi:hypothetical protein HN681_04610 [archaeon]|jgi:hypothetical protein|nr:hypothetical protein [archaeon]MBT3730989.1 hypothetical protein [archaeon]MBT4669773.1 hypothetical protein [archaeon]MBT5029923.1 hypothetical protein [archaeon]MBT5288495.1 hypothetical protein [archaeon]
MKKISILLLIILSLSLFSVSALTVDVDSLESNELTLSFSGLNTLDLKFTDLTVKVETNSLSDTYLADTSIEVSDNTIFLIADLTEILEDYSKEEIKYLTLTGKLDGQDFSKRVAYRESVEVRFQAAEVERGVSIIFWIIGAILVMVFLVLAYLTLMPKKRKEIKVYKKPSKRKVKKKVKKKTVKKKVKKKTSKKKVKKKKK